MKFKFFGKTVQLSHADRVAVAQQRAQVALGMFNTAHDTLEKANVDLRGVVEEASRQAADLLNQVSKANDEINMNKSVQNKLKEFIPQH